MKIALCLFGLIGGNAGIGGRGKQINPKNAYKYYKKNLIDHYDVDVFIHSWSIDLKDQLIELYKPKKNIIENQRKFEDVSLKNFGYNSIEELRAIEPYREPYTDFSDLHAYKNFETLLWRSYSRWYSTMMSINLKKEFELANDFKYDFVISSRFDIALLKKINFEKLNNSKFYASLRHNRNDFNKALYDLIFISSSDKMDDFSNLYNRFRNYTFRPTWASREHANYLNLSIDEILKYEKDYKLLRWNQNLMISDYNLFYYLRHTLKAIKNRWLRN